jgi:RNA polymerase sigma factor (sigma-70 family)
MPQTVAQTFSALQKRLFNFIRKRVSVTEDAEDILQEVFCQFTRVNTIGKPVEQTAAWLFRSARNLIINRRKKKGAVQFPAAHDDDEDGFFLQEIADVLFDEETTPETAYLRSVILDEINSAVTELPPEQREVFELMEYYGMPVKEIAKNTGVSVNTVLSRKHYAVVHLRKTLKELYYGITGGTNK